LMGEHFVPFQIQSVFLVGTYVNFLICRILHLEIELAGDFEVDAVCPSQMGTRRQNKVQFTDGSFGALHLP